MTSNENMVGQYVRITGADFSHPMVSRTDKYGLFIDGPYHLDYHDLEVSLLKPHMGTDDETGEHIVLPAGTYGLVLLSLDSAVFRVRADGGIKDYLLETIDGQVLSEDCVLLLNHASGVAVITYDFLTSSR